MQCHDCQEEITGEYTEYGYQKASFFKCPKCFEKDPVLRDYQVVECYSRVVGYMRPVAQWNQGKQEEFKDRKEFVVTI